jgi:hypothetical protein
VPGMTEQESLAPGAAEQLLQGPTSQVATAEGHKKRLQGLDTGGRAWHECEGEGRVTVTVV